MDEAEKDGEGEKPNRMTMEDQLAILLTNLSKNPNINQKRPAKKTYQAANNEGEGASSDR